MLETFLVHQVYSFLLIFCRIGSGLMALPGIGETYVPVRLRLILGLFMALALTPLLSKTLPPLPASVLALFVLTITEILVGIFIGIVCRIMISATHVAGMIFSFQSGLSSAVIYDVTQRSQGSLVGNFLGLVSVVLLFALDLHLLMLRGIMESYHVFVPGHLVPLGDMLETIARVASDTFLVAIQIATPLIVAGTLLFLGGGILARLMPTVQVFFILQSPQVLLSFFILITVFSGMMLWYMEFFKERLLGFMPYLK